ncbi:MAG: GerAB/ArcD/ProY family transporter [Faecousia sp.]
MNSAARRLYALGFCAFLVPAVLHLPSAGWLWTAAASSFCALLLAVLIALRRKCGHTLSEIAARAPIGRCVLLLVLLWNLLLLGSTAGELCAAYPKGNTFPLIGLLLLLLAAYAAERGEAVVLRVGAIVFFALLIFFALILGFALPKVHLAWLAPQTSVDWKRLTAVLCPTVVLYLGGSGEKSKCAPWLLLGVVFATLCAAVTVGTLSPAVASEDRFPFYTAAKSVSVLGAMERLEPLVSAALTAGGFCLLALICAANGRILGAFLPKAEKCTALLNFALGGSAMWLSKLLPAALIAVGTTIFWGIFPIITLSLGTRKKV